MTKIRVLVVDDSVVVRRLVSSALGEDPEIEVVGTASDGRQGVERVAQYQPDVVTLDIEMPVMNGIEALREIRKIAPRLPVIMFSTLTEAGASATLDALAAGASDFVAKPANVGSVTKSQEAIREQLVPKIRALTGRPVLPTLGGSGGAAATGFTPSPYVPTVTSTLPPAAPLATPAALPTPPAPTARPTPAAPPAPAARPTPAAPLAPAARAEPPPPAARPTPVVPAVAPSIATPLVTTAPTVAAALAAPTTPAATSTTPSTTDALAAVATRMTPFALRATARVSAIAIAVSTGGPNALSTIWPQLADLRVPIFVVQHMPPVFTASLAAKLTSYGTVPVDEGAAGDEVVSGRGYLAPGDHHMTVERSRTGVRLRLDQGPQVNGCRPAADPLFESVAALYGAGTLGLVLTGMGSDGTVGARAIRNAGGHLLAQDQDSCVVWGMPRSVTEAGLVDEVVPLRRIAATINAVAARSRGRQGVTVP